MALATQCPFCHTAFRVAGDQLKLRGGLVRCGHCNEVFDGNAHLLPDAHSAGNWPAPPIAPSAALTSPDTAAITPAMARANAAAPDYGAPPADLPPDAESMAKIEAAWALPPSLRSDRPDDFPAPEVNDGIDAIVDLDETNALMIESEDAQAADTPGRLPAGADADDDLPPLLLHPSSLPYDDAGADDTLPVDRLQNRTHPRNTQFDDTDSAAGDDDADTDADEDTAQQPAFIRAAQRRQRWARVRRILTITLCILLVFTGLAQGIYLERNRIAAAAPRLKPLLSAACQPLRCTVGLQRQIDQLSIESNELHVAVPDQPALALSLLLRNRSDIALVWPDIELTLNDDDENALIRRVFTPADYLPGRQTIEAGFAPDTEHAVKLSFTVTQGTASGYRVYLFYP